MFGTSYLSPVSIVRTCKDAKKPKNKLRNSESYNNISWIVHQIYIDDLVQDCSISMAIHWDLAPNQLYSQPLYRPRGVDTQQSKYHTPWIAIITNGFVVNLLAKWRGTQAIDMPANTIQVCSLADYDSINAQEVMLRWHHPGPHRTNDISIEFEMRSKLGVVWFQICSIYCNEILHTSRHVHCRDMCKISLWSVEHLLN